jgi:hypothetical protein
MCKKGCVVKRAEGDEFGKGTSFRDSKLDADDIYKSSDVWNTECWNPTLRVFNNQGEKVADGLIGRCALTAAILLSHLRLRTNQIVARWTPWQTTSFFYFWIQCFFMENDWNGSYILSSHSRWRNNRIVARWAPFSLHGKMEHRRTTLTVIILSCDLRWRMTWIVANGARWGRWTFFINDRRRKSRRQSTSVFVYPML